MTGKQSETAPTVYPPLQVAPDAPDQCLDESKLDPGLWQPVTAGYGKQNRTQRTEHRDWGQYVVHEEQNQEVNGENKGGRFSRGTGKDR